jgi:hypothetical protein
VRTLPGVTTPTTVPVVRIAAAAAAVAVLGLAVAAFVWRGWGPARPGAAACDRAAQIRGADTAQDRLIRCYLRAVADRSPAELQPLVPAPGDGGPTGFGAAVFAHSADARSGAASVAVTGNPVDDADATVVIVYADRARDQLDIHLVDPASGRSWRFWDVGSRPADPGAPAPAVP